MNNIFLCGCDSFNISPNFAIYQPRFADPFLALDRIFFTLPDFERAALAPASDPFTAEMIE